MAVPVQRLQPTKLPALPSSTTPEQRYWRTFASPLLIHEYSNVTSIHFSPHAPHDFAVTSSALVKIFSSKARAVTKTISRFKDTAYAGQIRRDGKIMAAADATGTVQVFDLASRAVLRTWAGEHKAPVQALRWNPRELTGLVTGGDDTTVRVWDLPARESVTTFTGHEDYVRSVIYLPVGGAAASTGGLVVSGSYDTTARIWDPRVGGKAAMTFRHDTAVEDVLAMPGGTTVLCATGNVVRVWDIVAAKEIAVLSNHQKTVTSLAQTSKTEKRRVLTGALDGHVKIYDTASWTVVHGVKYPAPILSLGVSPDEKHLAVGMVGGLLSIRTRRSGGEKDVIQERERAMDLIMKGLDPRAVDKKKGMSGNKARRLKGLDYKGEDEEMVIDAAPKKIKKERRFEKDLRKGRYSEALDRVLGEGGEPQMVLTVIKELLYRDAVSKALSNRDEESLRPVVEWCVRFIGDPRMVAVVTEVLNKVLDLYSHALGHSAEFDKLVGKLTKRIAGEVVNARQAQRAVGMLGMLVAGNE
ncbi:WD40-repeat-containing domain protein [Sphaerosporella brunnea]|uniref:WD40-repeat-containing domain protein n=1 Tax=Sphaerosporella brunnea TaxID=1250544 RepID=A0A5J5EYE5_9PEZI|nr:WD40-repeat-containing domain protein [Sphaerosporella brunnea]